MNKLFKILGPVLILIGSIVAYFSPVPIADYIGIGAAAIGLTLAVIATVKKADKITWKVIVPIPCFIIGGIACCVAGISEEQMTTLAMAVIGAVGIFVGLITSIVLKTEKKE